MLDAGIVDEDIDGNALGIKALEGRDDLRFVDDVERRLRTS